MRQPIGHRLYETVNRGQQIGNSNRRRPIGDSYKETVSRRQPITNSY